MKEAGPHWDKALAIPAVVALLTFIVIVVALYLLKQKRWGFKSTAGTTYVTGEDGQTVRRSTRSRRSVARWSPDNLASPTGVATPGSASKQVQEAVTAAVKKVETSVEKGNISSASLHELLTA
ncbi:hypothetical protein WJX81_002772 [Elliptochloris bilobata]|uniref:Uncharacterized protein n=1 Tax=Elliptochloris bilobata TaxID=381761 RepID=A0AAW1RU47_9CHLO